MSVDAAHMYLVNTTTQKDPALIRRARARELAIQLMLAGTILIVIHLATNLLGCDAWLIAGVTSFALGIVTIFRADAVYDRTRQAPADELAVRRLLRN